MKRVIASLSEVELEVLRSILQESGVPSVIRHEERSGVPGCTPFDAELWVEHDDDFAKANELYEAWCEPVPETVEAWNCPTCGQRLAVQFDSCWKCGCRRGTKSELPCSCAEVDQRAEQMSSVLVAILHQPENPS
jgi:hypothetical protein